MATFVNGERISSAAALAVGDVVRVGGSELVIAIEQDGYDSVGETLVLDPLSAAMVGGCARQISARRELLAQGQIEAAVEPLVDLSNGHVVGFESLAHSGICC